MFYQQYISTCIITQIIDKAFDIFKQRTFANRYSYKYSTIYNQNIIDNVISIQTFNNLRNQAIKVEIEPQQLSFDNLMNAAELQHHHRDIKDNKIQQNSLKVSKKQNLTIKKSNSLSQNKNVCLPMNQIPSLQVPMQQQQQKYMQILRKYKLREIRLIEQIKNDKLFKKQKKIIPIKSNDKIIFDYNGKVHLNNINNKNNIPSIASLRNTVAASQINKKVDRMASIATEMKSITNSSKDKYSQKRQSIKFQFNYQQMAESIQLVDKKIKMWFNGKQITKFQKNASLQPIQSFKKIKQKNHDINSHKNNALSGQLADSQKQIHQQSWHDKIKRQIPNQRRQKFVSEMKQRPRIIERIKTEKLQQIDHSHVIRFQKKGFNHLKTQGLTSEVRPNRHYLKIQIPAYTTNLLPEDEQMSFKSVTLNSAKKIKTRQLSSINEDINMHISKVRQCFSHIDPKQKLPIIIKKQNRIQTQVFEELKKERDVKLSKNYRLLLAQKMLTEVSVQWTKRVNKLQK